jgi:hypothetical protein
MSTVHTVTLHHLKFVATVTDSIIKMFELISGIGYWERFHEVQPLKKNFIYVRYIV